MHASPFLISDIKMMCATVLYTVNLLNGTLLYSTLDDDDDDVSQSVSQSVKTMDLPCNNTEKLQTAITNTNEWSLRTSSNKTQDEGIESNKIPQIVCNIDISYHIISYGLIQ